MSGRSVPKSSDSQPETAPTETAKEERATFKSCPRVMRFNAALLVLISLGLLQLLAQTILPGAVAGIIVVILGIFAYEFNGVHGPAMTRHKRAYFDVANVLETYQPRARTLGHLFQPEPPTPGNVSFDPSSDTDTHDMKNADAAFTNARDSHYANMYEHAIKMAKEMEAMEKAAAVPSLDAAQMNATLTPADPEADKKAHDEKKKKQEDDYKKQLEKPFSC